MVLVVAVRISLSLPKMLESIMAYQIHYTFPMNHSLKMVPPNQSTLEAGKLTNIHDYNPLLHTRSCWDVVVEIILPMLSHSSILFHPRYTEPAPCFQKSCPPACNAPYRFCIWSPMF